MQRIDQILRAELCTVDRFACAAAARALSGYRSCVSGDESNEGNVGVSLAFKLGVTAICHSINWDFLRHRLAEALSDLTEPQLVARLTEVKPSDVQEWLKGYKDDKRIRAKERAALLKDIGRKLTDVFGGSALEIYRRSAGRLVGTGGFYELLDAFDAYRADPLRKKSNVLVHDLVRERLVTFVDEREMRPAIDYHLIRLYLRSGRVVPKYGALLEVLKTPDENLPTRPRMDRLIRQAVEEAVALTAQYANLSVADVNFIEWQLGRNICVRERPLCLDGDGGLDDLPEDVRRVAVNSCPYLGFCPSFVDPDWRAISEPQFKSTFY